MCDRVLQLAGMLEDGAFPIAACANIDFTGRGEIWENMKTRGERNRRREKG